MYVANLSVETFSYQYFVTGKKGQHSFPRYVHRQHLPERPTKRMKKASASASNFHKYYVFCCLLQIFNVFKEFDIKTVCI